MTDAEEIEGQYIEASPSTDSSSRFLTLSSYLNAIGAGEVATVSSLVNYLESVTVAALHEETPVTEDIRNDVPRILSEILNFLSSSIQDDEVMDALSFELPKVVAEFAAVSDECAAAVDSILDCLAEKCSPRDMLSILCEALGFTNRSKNPARYTAPLYTALGKVTRCIQRRPFQQIAAIVPITLNVLKFLSSDISNGENECMNLFQRALTIADSIQAIRERLDGKATENIEAILAMYVMQVMALLSISMGSCITSSCFPLVNQIKSLLRSCGCSFSGLMTGSDIDTFIRVTNEVEEDSSDKCFSEVKLGASLVVIWCKGFEEQAQAAAESIANLEDELRGNQIKRWQSLAMLKHALLAPQISWKLKEHAIEFMLSITRDAPRIAHNEEQCDECLTYLPNLCSALQVIAAIIPYAPSRELRTNAFLVLKRVVADIPPSSRLESLQFLIKNSSSPQMGALLIDITREELHKEINHAESVPSWWTSVVDVVEMVLRPSDGGPPNLPESSEAVLAALNLYRYVVMAESSRGSNHSGVLRKESLRRAYAEWLLPLRALVSGIISESKNDCVVLSSVSTLEMVLYRCIELVEDRLKVCV